MAITRDGSRVPSVFLVKSGSKSDVLESPERHASVLPLFAMGLVVVVWGIAPPISKLITASPLVSTFIRFGVSMPVFLLLLTVRGRWLSVSIFRSTALPGLCFGFNLIFVFAAVQQTTISLLSTVMATQPALLLLLAAPLFDERPSIRQLYFTLVGIGGAIIVVLGAGGELGASIVGLGYAGLSMVTFTAYFVLTRLARTGKEVDPIEWMAGINIWAFLATVLPALVILDRSDWAEFGGRDWLWILIIAFVTGIFGHVLMTWVHGHMEVARSSLYNLAMHLVAVGLAWPLHDEPITATQAFGGVVLLGSVALVISAPSRPRAQ